MAVSSSTSFLLPCGTTINWRRCGPTRQSWSRCNNPSTTLNSPGKRNDQQAVRPLVVICSHLFPRQVTAHPLLPDHRPAAPWRTVAINLARPAADFREPVLSVVEGLSQTIVIRREPKVSNYPDKLLSGPIGMVHFPLTDLPSQKPAHIAILGRSPPQFGPAPDL